MTDKELLERAAKAAEVELEWGIYERGFWIEPESKCFHRTEAGRRKEWNPLTDDGDALRLAAKLRLALFLELPSVVRIGPRMESPDYWLDENEDELSATRRAIVIAAAEIGKENKHE